MADHKYKLFRAIDPNKVTVPLNEKFSKLTLSSHKKRPQQREREPQQDQEQQLPQEALAMRDNLETEQLDGSDYMDALQLSANTDVDVEQLSASVSHLTMHSKQEQQQQQQQVSICISSTTEEDDAITISDTSEDEDQEQADPEPDSMAVSEREPEPAPQSILTSDKVQRIEAFLRDVERHVGDHTPPSSLASSYSARRRSQIALADTESMTTPHTDEDWEQPPRPIDSSKRLADDDTVLDMDSSKRLADDATEANTLSSQSLEPESPEIKSISQRLAGNDTELNSTLQDEEAEEDEPIPEESIEIPETGSEGEEEGEAEAVPVASPLRPSSSSSSSSGNYETPSVQVSSINISAKINIKISIPTGYSSSGEEEEQEKEQDQAQRKLSSELVEVQEQKQLKQNQKSLISSSGDASEDEQFLSQAERLLNQLYGESWQTPDVIRTLKRSSGSGGQRKPLKPRNLEAPMAATTTKKKRQPAATTTTKKRQPARPKPVDESLLGDFSIFTRPLRTNQTPLNSTHLPPPQPPLRAVQTERRPRHPPRARTNHVDEERWRALIDSESGTDASDDEDADATYTGSESSSSDSGIKSRPKKAQDKDLTYLDLTKDEVEVISNPDEEEEDSQSPKIHRRLDDILRSCRATSKLKLPATPPPPPPAPQTTTRRQLFTPNAGYEDDNEAREIVAKALDLDMLDELENDYLPGTPVHKRLQEVKRNLGIVKPGETDLNKGKSIFDKATPKSSTRKKKEAVQPSQIQKGNGGKCSFLKSLEGQVSREKADNEAYFYRENFAKNKELLAQHLYKLFNAQVFNNELDVPLTWSKLLRNTAGRCMNKRKLNQRSSVVELSLKVLTTADRLRCTLIHELCHAAAWVFNGEGGHGRVWKMWAKRANDKFPDLPPIKVCHNYSIEFKYTYKCMSCNTSSHAHSRSRKVENLRCRLCRGPITLLLNKKDKQGNTVSTPAGEAKGFAKFVKDNFQKFKQDHLTAAQVMRLLGVEYAKQKEGEAASIASRVQTLTLDD